MSDAKKRKIGSAQKEKKAPPPYGDRLYWEERYKKHRLVEEIGCHKHGETASPPHGEIVADNDALPNYAWYFSYGELRPLILPLILGGREQALEVIASSSVEGHDADNSDNPDQTQLSKEVGERGTSEKSPQVAKHDETEPKAIPPEAKVATTGTTCMDIKVDTNSNDEEERHGLARAGPISVLEVGCGDVPLGSDLAMELQELEQVTGEKANNVVNKIVCCDYSEAVIDTLRQPQACPSQKTPAPQHGTTSDGVRDHPIVEYVVADARKLSYPDAAFHLVLEKGTLDAMLSDKEIGISNCILIVTECARVLAVGGYLLIVSHLNAHTKNGLEWLDEIIVPGLRAGGGDATWEIEVHGSDGSDEVICDSDEENQAEEDDQPAACAETTAKGGDSTVKNQATNVGVGEDVEDERSRDSERRPPSGSPGPAVYIIHKMAPKPGLPKADNDEPPTVPLKLFGY